MDPTGVKNREDFLEMLGRTSAEIDGLAAREPAYPVWSNLQRQLRAMREWTANGADPTPEQLQSISIGLIAARELEPAPDAAVEDLVGRLHLLSYYWRRWKSSSNRPTAAPTPVSRRIGKFLMMIVATVAAIVVVAAIAIARLGNIAVPHGIPLGRSVRTANYIVTFIETLQPYRVSLHHNPEDERFRVGLLLVSSDGRAPARVVPIAAGLRVSEYRHDTRPLGDDGRFFWFYVKEIGALDLKTDKLITTRDLRSANPSLDDIWANGRYEFTNRLRVTTHDYGRTFDIEPVTLKAVPISGSASRNGPLADRGPEQFLSSGELVSPTEWLGVHSVPELERSFSPGSSFSRENRPEKSAAPRFIYRGRVEASSFGPRIESMVKLTGVEYRGGAFVTGPSDSQPMRLSGPDGFLLVYSSPPNPAVPGLLFQGKLLVARIDLNGMQVWAADTGIGDLEQILPDRRSIALVGTRPRVPDKVPEPVLVIIDNQSGRVSTISLWQ